MTHAIIRVLLTGMLRDEVAKLRVEDLDLTARVLITVGLKGKPGRPVAFGHKTSLALARWLRVRASNPYAPSPDTGPLWLGVRNRARLTGSGALPSPAPPYRAGWPPPRGGPPESVPAHQGAPAPRRWWERG